MTSALQMGRTGGGGGGGGGTNEKDPLFFFQVFDPADKMVLKVQFMVFGDKARRSSVESHFALDDFCVISHLPEHRHLLPRLVNCEQKEWSLFYPDPKSAFMQDRHVML